MGLYMPHYSRLKGFDGHKFRKARREQALYVPRPPTPRDKSLEENEQRLRLQTARTFAVGDIVQTSDGKVGSIKKISKRGQLDIAIRPTGRVVSYASTALVKYSES